MGTDEMILQKEDGDAKFSISLPFGYCKRRWLGQRNADQCWEGVIVEGLWLDLVATARGDRGQKRRNKMNKEQGLEDRCFQAHPEGRR